MRLNLQSWVREKNKVVAKRWLEIERAKKKKDKEAKRTVEKTKRFVAKVGKKAEGNA